MKKLLIILLALVAIFSNPALAQRPKKVLFIGIDGVRSDALNARAIPNIRELMANGTYTFDSWHPGTTMSGPSWSTMLTGVFQAKHNVRDNSYSGSRFNDYPYISKRFKEVKPNGRAVQICTWRPMTDLVYNDGWDQKIVPANDAAVVTTAATQLLNPNIDYLFCHLDIVDITGHGSGFNPNNPQYNAAIDSSDARVGRIVRALRNRPNYANEDWIIMLTTDHGGTGTGHGGNTNDERHIWWVANGAGIPRLQITGSDPGSYVMTTNPVRQADFRNIPNHADIAVTALQHLLANETVDSTLYNSWRLDGRSWIDLITSNSTVLEPENNKFATAYPNPNNGAFKLNIAASNIEVLEYTLTDATGKQLEKGTKTNVHTVSPQFDLTKYAKGLYTLTVKAGSKQNAMRIVLR